MSGGEGVRNPADLQPVLDILGDFATTLADAITEIAEDMETISAIVNALPTLAETGGTVTTDGTEQNVYVNNVPLGVFEPRCVKIDCSNQTAGETIVIRTYYQIAAGVPAPILQDTLTFVGLISPELINIDLGPNRFGVWVTIERTAGVARAYPWEAFYEI